LLNAREDLKEDNFMQLQNMMTKNELQCIPPGRALPWRRRRRTFEVGASSCGGIEATWGGSQTGK